jgi:hypothetical protein
MVHSGGIGIRNYLQVKGQIDLDSGELRCPKCFGKDLVPSLPRGFMDWMMARFDYIPRHCRICGSRFYVAEEALRGRPEDAVEGAEQNRPPATQPSRKQA